MPKNIARKRFACTKCSLTSLSLSPDDAAKSKAAHGKKSAGFAGFSRDESSKPNEPKPSIDLTQTQAPVVAKKAKTAATVERIQNGRSSTSSKSSVSEQKPNIMDILDFEIKQEVHTPTSDRNAIRFDQFDAIDQIKPHPNDAVAESEFRIICVDLKEAEDEGIASEPVQPASAYDKASKVRPHENIPDCRNWDCDEVYTYFMGTTTAEYAELFKENEIDGDALLLMKRDDVLNRFNLKLGPALRLYAHIVSLQYKNNNPILTWNEYWLSCSVLKWKKLGITEKK